MSKFGCKWGTWANTKKAYIKPQTFYLVIFLTVFPKLLIEIEWKIANLAKTNVEVSFKKNPQLNPKIIFKIMSEENVKLCFLRTFNIIISYIFPEYFIEIHQDSQKIWIFISSILTIFINFLDFLGFTCYKNTNDVIICDTILAVFWHGVILNKFLKNCIKLY